MSTFAQQLDSEHKVFEAPSVQILDFERSIWKPITPLTTIIVGCDVWPKQSSGHSPQGL